MIIASSLRYVVSNDFTELQVVVKLHILWVIKFTHANEFHNTLIAKKIRTFILSGVSLKSRRLLLSGQLL